MREHDDSGRVEYIVNLSNLCSIVRNTSIVACSIVLALNILCFVSGCKVSLVLDSVFLVFMILYVRVALYVMQHWYVRVYKDILVLSRVFRKQTSLSVSEVVYDVDKYGNIVIGSMWVNHITTVPVFADNRDRHLRKLEKESHTEYIEGY